MPPNEILKNLQDGVNNSLAAYLAHIAASAHAAVVCAANNHFYKLYYHQKRVNEVKIYKIYIV